MAIQRIKIDTKGKNILQVFFDNMEEIGAINKLTRDDGADTYDGPAEPVPIAWPRRGKYKNAWKYPITYQKYFVREITAPKMPTGLTEQEATMYEAFGPVYRNAFMYMGSRISDDTGRIIAAA